MRNFKKKRHDLAINFSLQYNKKRWQINAGIQALLIFVKQEITGQNDITSNIRYFRYDINGLKRYVMLSLGM